MSKCSSVPTLRTQNSGATPKTPKRRKCTDPVEVFCRLRPLLSTDAGQRCLEQISETTVKLTAPVGSQGSRNQAVAMFYTFNSIFDEQSTQKSVFDKLALPLVHDLILGKNGLLFAYGVTCSGKTHTMIGETDNPGILPRCLDVVFNSIGENQAKPYIFLPDDTNGMTIQAEYNAALMKNNIERQKRQTERLKKGNKNAEGSTEKLSEIRIPDSTKLECVNDDSAYAVFISYTEVYNKYIFDLLADEQVDEFGQAVLPESKSVREDTKRKVMYVNNIKEVEVKSTEEACDQLWKGQDRRRRAETLLNDRSSRSHSVFTIRLVQAPYDEQGNRILMNKDQITISQLSLVDLAGSERPSRTKAVGEQLKEAGNINSSLMTLHTCLEILRYNQLSGRSKEKLVPYRDNKLTFLFKNYFEGEGRVRMAVCVNPRSEDYDETIHVMKFAEMTQDVVVARGQEVQFNENLAPGRRKNNLLFKRVSQGGEALTDITNKSFGFNLPNRPPAFSLPPFPVWRVQEGSSEDKLQAVLSALHERQRIKKEALEDYEKRQQRMKAVIVQLERENESMSSTNAGNSDELKMLRAELSQANTDKARLEKENMKQKRENEKLKKQNALYMLEQRRIEEERSATEERVRKEKLKRENMKKTFKGVVGREKDKWEKQTERLLLKHELAGARQDAKLRQVLEIVGGSPAKLSARDPLQTTLQLPDVEFPSTSNTSQHTDTSTDSLDSPPQVPQHDSGDYALPFSKLRSGVKTPVGGVKVLPAVSKTSVNSKTPSRAINPTDSKPSSKVPTPAPSSRHPMSGAATPKSGVVTPKSAALTPKTPTNPPSEVISKPRSGRGKAKSPHASHPTLTPPVLPARNIESVMEGAGVECVINVDDRPNIPLKARIVPSAGNSCAKWLNHKPLENFDEGDVLQPKLTNKKTVAIPEVEHFDSDTNKYMLAHQQNDSHGEIMTQYIKGDIKMSKGGGRVVEFTDVEIASKNPCSKAAFTNFNKQIYPPPVMESGDWTDTETRCKVGVGIPSGQTKKPER